MPLSDFMKGYPAEMKQWWDDYGPSNWGATSDDTAAMIGGLRIASNCRKRP